MRTRDSKETKEREVKSYGNLLANAFIAYKEPEKPSDDYKSLYGSAKVISKYLADPVETRIVLPNGEVKTLTAEEVKAKQKLANTENVIAFQKQFNHLLDAFMSWGKDHKLEAVLPTIEEFRRQCFDEKSIGSQPPLYFEMNKFKLEQIWFLFTQKHKSPGFRDKCIDEYKSLFESLLLCGPSKALYIDRAYRNLTDPRCLEGWLSRLRGDNIDTVSVLFQKIFQQETGTMLHAGSRSHINSALAAFAQKKGWAPPFDSTQIHDNFIRTVGLDDINTTGREKANAERWLAALGELFLTMYQRSIVNVIQERFFEAYSSDFPKAAENKGYIEGADISAVNNLLVKIGFDKEIFLSSYFMEYHDENGMLSYNPEKFKAAFLNYCFQKKLLFNETSWQSQTVTLPVEKTEQLFQLICFKEEYAHAWLESKDNPFMPLIDITAQDLGRLLNQLSTTHMSILLLNPPKFRFIQTDTEWNQVFSTLDSDEKKTLLRKHRDGSLKEVIYSEIIEGTLDLIRLENSSLWDLAFKNGLLDYALQHNAVNIVTMLLNKEDQSTRDVIAVIHKNVDELLRLNRHEMFIPIFEYLEAYDGESLAIVSTKAIQQNAVEIITTCVKPRIPRLDYLKIAIYELLVDHTVPGSLHTFLSSIEEEDEIDFLSEYINPVEKDINFFILSELKPKTREIVFLKVLHKITAIDNCFAIIDPTVLKKGIQLLASLDLNHPNLEVFRHAGSEVLRFNVEREIQLAKLTQTLKLGEDRYRAFFTNLSSLPIDTRDSLLLELGQRFISEKKMLLLTRLITLCPELEINDFFVNAMKQLSVDNKEDREGLPKSFLNFNEIVLTSRFENRKHHYFSSHDREMFDSFMKRKNELSESVIREGFFWAIRGRADDAVKGFLVSYLIPFELAVKGLEIAIAEKNLYMIEMILQYSKDNARLTQECIRIAEEKNSLEGLRTAILTYCNFKFSSIKRLALMIFTAAQNNEAKLPLDIRTEIQPYWKQITIINSVLIQELETFNTEDKLKKNILLETLGLITSTYIVMLAKVHLLRKKEVISTCKKELKDLLSQLPTTLSSFFGTDPIKKLLGKLVNPPSEFKEFKLSHPAPLSTADRYKDCFEAYTEVLFVNLNKIPEDAKEVIDSSTITLETMEKILSLQDRCRLHKEDKDIYFNALGELRGFVRDKETQLNSIPRASTVFSPQISFCDACNKAFNALSADNKVLLNSLTPKPKPGV